jgi:hypothetical protein
MPSPYYSNEKHSKKPEFGSKEKELGSYLPERLLSGMQPPLFLQKQPGYRPSPIPPASRWNLSEL